MKHPTYTVTERIARLRQRALNDEPCMRAYQGYRGWLFCEGYAEAEGLSSVQRRARGLARVLRELPVVLWEDERLVGHHYLGDEQLDFPELMGWDARRDQRLPETRLTAEQRQRYSQLAGAMPRYRGDTSLLGPLPEEITASQERRILSIFGSLLNHSIRGYATLLAKGFTGLAADIAAALAQADTTEPSYARRRTFWLAALEIAQAGAELGSRYAVGLERAALDCPAPHRRAELREMADICRQVPAGPARTFREAVQALWFGHMVTCWEDAVNANGIGRIDQILWPYYRDDLAAGRITPEQALELLAELWIKLYRSYDVQQMMIGGQTADGADATNELSYLVLEVTRALGFVRCLSVRLHRDSPRPLVRRSVDLLAQGGGIPFFFNDDTMIPALTAKGIPLEEARDYAAIGCVEITIPGRAAPHAVSNYMNLAKCLELALHDGVDPTDGAQVGPRTGKLTDHDSIEDVWRAYQAQVAHFGRLAAQGSNQVALLDSLTFSLPYRSMLTEDCIQRGLDINWGGARYDYHESAAIGIPNVGDSLEALAQLVFGQRVVERSTLLDALAADFVGYEDLQQALLRRAPKYGNDIDSVDAWVARAAAHYCELLDGIPTLFGGRFFVHLFSFLVMIDFGRATGALPDGRRARTPLAYSVSAAQGRDESGVTAMLLSLSKLPHDQAAGSSSAIIEVTPKLLVEVGRERFTDLLITAIRQGVGQMQWNVVDADVLREAQSCPEAHRNLCVRVSGFSQQFVLLDRALQDHIIARTKHEG